jgi:hypothetical protein
MSNSRRRMWTIQWTSEVVTNVEIFNLLIPQAAAVLRRRTREALNEGGHMPYVYDGHVCLLEIAHAAHGSRPMWGDNPSKMEYCTSSLRPNQAYMDVENKMELLHLGGGSSTLIGAVNDGRSCIWPCIICSLL